MIYFIKNFHFNYGVLEIETEDSRISIDTKYLDYFVTLKELAKSGVIVTYMRFDISDRGIRCMDSDTNLIIGRKYNSLFGNLSNKDNLKKCKKLLGIK